MARKKVAAKPTARRTAKRPARAPARRRHHRRGSWWQRLTRLTGSVPFGLRDISLVALAGLVLVLWLDRGERRPAAPAPRASYTAPMPAAPAARPTAPSPERIAVLQRDEREAPPLPAPVRPAPQAIAPAEPPPSIPPAAAGSVQTAGLPTLPAPAAIPRLPAARPEGPALRPAVPPAPASAAVAIIIDDVGVAQGWARRAVRLPAPVTLAFLPYADHLPELTAEARANGHEIFLHLAMEPQGNADPGPNALLASLGEEELRRRITWAIGRVPDAVGANNHMGSRLTAEAAPMRVVMDELRRAKLLFVDSMTTPASVAGATAAVFGIPHTNRDVFLDNEAEAGAISAQLARAERLARRNGTAVAIGHPYPATMKVLESWLPEARRRGIRLVSASEMIEIRRCGDGAAGCLLNARAEARR
ncbi:divergent polysaccharide deacetylase family protein [Marinimicrococcus flavescens]|uniref:Divergent polysaccharide deacetylase family protein n=1 Tax=Marinimicrococcus flavescens TaxID=3031815 RepID=A0AAP3XSH9_9PROT|nr:divergent polysaccharide deacetylase family protein [Marinimicrococcus flavescens]